MDDDGVTCFQPVGRPQVAGRTMSRIRAVAFPSRHDGVLVMPETIIVENGKVCSLLDGSFPIVPESGNVHPAENRAVFWRGFDGWITFLRLGYPLSAIRSGVFYFFESFVLRQHLLGVNLIHAIADINPTHMESEQYRCHYHQSAQQLQNMPAG